MSKFYESKRQFLMGAGMVAIGSASLALLGFPKKGYALFGFGKKNDVDRSNFPYHLTDERWREKLSAEAYKVLRQAGTERSGSSPLNHEKHEGTFHCKGCDNPLYSSAAKYDSGTGWPSFFQPISDTAIGTAPDNTLFYTRTEVHCANCGGHLGHVFDDGPQPTGLRYCMNGVAMTFTPS